MAASLPRTCGQAITHILNCWLLFCMKMKKRFSALMEALPHDPPSTREAPPLDLSQAMPPDHCYRLALHATMANAGSAPAQQILADHKKIFFCP